MKSSQEQSTVGDFMNPTLVYLPEGTRPEVAKQKIIEFGITAVPVVDDRRRPVGVVSLRDLLDARRSDDPMTSPAKTVGVHQSIYGAAEAMTKAEVHHLVVVDSEGRACGMLSALDVIRAMIGLKSRHPAAINRV